MSKSTNRSLSMLLCLALLLQLLAGPIGMLIPVAQAAEKQVLFSEDFEGITETIAANKTGSSGWKVEPETPNQEAVPGPGNPSVEIANGVMTVKGDSDCTYTYVSLVSAEGQTPANWTNYTVEADMMYKDCAPNYAGMVYNGTSSRLHQKAGIYKPSGVGKFFLNGRDGLVKVGTANWLNNGTANHTENTKLNSLDQNVKFRMKVETYNQTGTADGNAKLSVAFYNGTTLGAWTEIADCTISAKTYKGTIGFLIAGGVKVEVDNIEVYATDTTDLPEPSTTAPTQAPEPEEDPIVIRSEIEVLYEEDFDSYTEDIVLNTKEAQAGWIDLTGQGTFTISDGALNYTKTAGGYGVAKLDTYGSDKWTDSAGWSNYTVEMDFRYNNGATGWAAVAYNLTHDTLHQKFGIYGERNFFVNGRAEDVDGKMNWQNDFKGAYADGYNHITGNDGPIEVKYDGTTYRFKIETSNMTDRKTGTVTVSVAQYDGDTLGDWVKLGTWTNISQLTYQGTIGLVANGNNTDTNFSVDNIKVYREKKYLYEDDFSEGDGSEWKVLNGTVEVEVKDGALHLNNTAGRGYVELDVPGSYNWQNYTVEADVTYNCKVANYMGIAYNARGYNLHQKGGIYSENMFFLNGRSSVTLPGAGDPWVNNGSENHSPNSVVNFRTGDTFRLKIESYANDGATTGSVRFSYNMYKDGQPTEWLKIAQVDNIDATTFKGTIGFFLASFQGTIDNLEVYYSMVDMEAPSIYDKLGKVSDIYEPTKTTGVVNPPVVGQVIVDALPVLTEKSPAVMFVNIDEALNIMANDDKTVITDMDSFLRLYKKTVIPAFIISSEEEADALADFVLEHGLLDIYVFAKSGEMTYSKIEATAADGKDIYTATCPGADLIASVTTAYGISRNTTTNLRGGLIMDADLLNSDLNADGKVNYDDLAVICHMAANDTGVTTIVFDGALTVDHMNYFNNHSIAVWGTAMDAADVYAAISAGWFGVAVEQPATAYDVYESIEATTLSGRPMPINHRGAHMGGYSASLNVTKEITNADGTTWTFHGETENSVEAMLASWNYFGIIGAEIDLCTTATCSGDDATCSHTIIEGAGACDHKNCELCQTNIILEHDKNLAATTNFNAMQSQYPNIFNHGAAPQSYTLFELKMLTLTGRTHNVPTGTKKMATFEEVLAATEALAGGNFVYYCHINHNQTQTEFNKLMQEHPEYIDNNVIFMDAGGIESYYNWSTLTAPVPITFADNSLLTNTVNQDYMNALEDMITLMNRHNGHFLGYSYRCHTDGDDDFYYRSAARGIVAYHSITNGQAALAQRHITGEGAVGCLTDQSSYVDDWFYYADVTVPEEVNLNEVLDVDAVIRTIEGDRTASKNRTDVELTLVNISGPAFTKGDDGWTADQAGESTFVFYYDGTAEGATYRVYSAPVTVTVVDPVAVESAKKVAAAEEAIDAIGEVTLDSKEAIEAAREAYDALTDDEKAQVENYADLTAAEEAYAKAVADKEAAEEAEKALKAAKDAAYEEIAKLYGELNTADLTEAQKELLSDAKGLAETYIGTAFTLEEVASALEAGAEAMREAVKEEEKPDPDPIKIPFTDVDEKAFYYDSMVWAVQKNITTGTTATTFEPGAACTRGQVVTFLWRAKGSPEPKTTENPFKDVKEGAFYYKAVLWAVENGITNGLSKTEFGPDAICTRGHVVTFLHRTLNKPAVEKAENPFKDVKEGTFYYDAVLWAVEAKVTSGISATEFAPGDDCTRGQIVTFLCRALSE